MSLTVESILLAILTVVRLIYYVYLSLNLMIQFNNKFERILI